MTYLRSIVFAVLFMCMGSQSACAGQEGMGGLNVNPPREIQAEGIIITWSETNDELRGFSQKLGEWEVLKIDPQKLHPGQAIIPIVAANVAAVRIGDSVAAFSGEKGWWDVVDLAKGAGSELTAYPTVSPSLVKVEDNGHLYTFSASKGEWTSPTDPELQPATFEVSLRSGPVEDGSEQFKSWLAQQPQYEARRISLKFLYNRPIVTTTRQSTMKVVRQKIEEFWCPRKPVVKEATPVPEPKRSSAEIDSQITKLREDLATLESTVQAGSGQLSNPNVDQEQQTRELRKLVEQSFDLRQQLQELEAQRLRLKLQQVENNLAVRAKSRDAMVTWRMEELRRPDNRNKVAPQEQDNRSTSPDKAPDRYLVDPIQQMRPLTAIGDDDSARLSNGRGTWNEVLDVIKLLEDKKKSYEPIQTAVQSCQQKQERFARPFNDWTVEERQEFENTLKALLQEKPVNSELAADLDAVLREYRNVYIRLGIMKADSEEAQPELSAETQERIRADLVNHHFSQKQVFSQEAANVVREWTTVWNLYVARRRELELSVERGEESLSEMDRQAEKILVGDKQTAKSVESQKRQAQLIVEQLRARLQPFLDLEKDHPELKPPGIHATDAEPEAEASASVAKVADNLPQQVISMAEQLRKLRDAAVKIREERQPHENLITQYSRPLEQLKAEGVVTADTTGDFLKTQIARSKPEFDRLTEKLDAATKAWKQAWSAYQSQSRLLELEVTHAQNSLVSAEQTLRETHAKMNQGLVGSQEVRETEARREAAVSRLEKAREVLHLWQELENNEPELRPESSTKNLQVSGSGEAKTQKGIWDTEKGKTLNELLKELRDEALRLRKERQADEALLTQCSRPLEELKAEGIVSAETTVEELERKIKESRARFDSSDLAIAMQRWREAWNAYPRGIQSMENQIKELERRIETEQKVLEQAEARRNAGLGERDDVLKSELRLKHWKEETLPQLKKSVEVIQEEINRHAPELNPDWKAESDSTTAEPTQK